MQMRLAKGRRSLQTYLETNPAWCRRMKERIRAETSGAGLVALTLASTTLGPSAIYPPISPGAPILRPPPAVSPAAPRAAASPAADADTGGDETAAEAGGGDDAGGDDGEGE